jgi:hypothetical protein
MSRLQYYRVPDYHFVMLWSVYPLSKMSCILVYNDSRKGAKEKEITFQTTSINHIAVFGDLGADCLNLTPTMFCRSPDRVCRISRSFLIQENAQFGRIWSICDNHGIVLHYLLKNLPILDFGRETDIGWGKPSTDHGTIS